MRKTKDKKYFSYLILVLVTLLVGFPLLRLNILNGHDSVFHLFRTYSIKAALSNGELIPMINPYMMGGFGYGANMFYGIFTSYIAIFLSFFTPTYGLAINLLILISIFFSGFTMYRFLYYVTNNKNTALIGSIFYMIAPYHLFDIYVRMALGEIVSFVFIPLVFHGLYNIINKDGNKWYLLTIGTSGLFLTHNLSTILVAIFAFFYILFDIKKILKKETIKKMFISLSLAFLISMPSFVPLLEAKKSSDYMVFDSNYMHTDGIDMVNRSINLFKQPYNFLYIIVIVYIILLILAFIYLIKRKNKNTGNLIYHSLVLSSISVFLTLSIIPWHYLPNIFSIFQFPWRYLQMTSFFTAILFSLLFQEINNKKTLKLITIILVIFSVFTTSPLLYKGIVNKTISDKTLNNNSLKKRNNIVRSVGTASAEYLPRNAIYNYDYLSTRDLNPLILNGNGNIFDVNKKESNLIFKVSASDKVLIELPYIYYPGYIIKANKVVIDNFETENGLLGIELNNGNYDIITSYRGTKLMIIAYFLSLLTMIGIAIYVYKSKKNN